MSHTVFNVDNHIETAGARALAEALTCRPKVMKALDVSGLLYLLSKAINQAMIAENDIDLSGVVALVQSVALCPKLSSMKLFVQQGQFNFQHSGASTYSVMQQTFRSCQLGSVPGTVCRSRPFAWRLPRWPNKRLSQYYGLNFWMMTFIVGPLN